MIRPNARSHSITSQESFSAVMITDMVADVNVNPELENSTKTTKEETNLAFDGQMDGELKSPPMEDADSTKVNGAGISKGVILNAVQFGSNDSKKTFDEKPMQLTANLAIPTLSQPAPEPKGFKDMTLSRKIAFGFSFLPSIFFVLCFAVILPCKVPRQCVEEVWTATFNNTGAISGLELTNKIVLTAFKEDKHVLMELEKIDGNWTEIELPSRPAYLKCGKIFDETRKDCMVMDESGSIHIFNDTGREFFWDHISEAENLTSSPLIMPGCKEKDGKDGLEDIAIAVSNTIIKFLHGGNQTTNFLVTHCDSVPVKLMSWNASDVIFVCDSEGNDTLVKISRNPSCLPSQDSLPKVLETGPLDSLKKSVIKPLEDNRLVLWSESNVSMLQSDGTVLWRVNVSHLEENQFILHGSFLDEDKYLALFSSNPISGLQVVLLNPYDGSFVKKLSFEDVKAVEAIHIEGKKRDFALLLLKKVKLVSSTIATAFAQISDIPSTIVSILSNEKLYDGNSKSVVEELSLLDMKKENLESMKEINDIEDPDFKSTMAAKIDQYGALDIYLLRTWSNSQMNTTEVRNINVANWDKTSKSKCLAK